MRRHGVRVIPARPRQPRAATTRPFCDAALPALLWTDTGNFCNPHYHQPTDTPETLEYVFLRHVTDLLCGMLERAGIGGD